MPEIPAVLLESECNSTQRSSFRTAPWFILGEKTYAGNGTALVLSVLWCAKKADGYTKLSNEEISKRSGLNCSSKAIRYHLVKLEKFGYIKRHGNHCNRTIEITFDPYPNIDPRGLTIPPDIFTSDLSPTQKLIASIERAFPDMSPTTICERLGISKWTYWTKRKPPKEANGNPLKKQMEPPKKANAIGIGGGVKRVELLSKDNKKGAAHPTIDLFGGDKKMITNIPEIGTRRPAPRSIPSDPYARLTSSPSKNIPDIPSPEIEEVWKSFPNNAKHKSGNKTYEMAKATISQLRRSPRVGLSSGQIEKLINRMTTDPRNKFTIKQVNEFLDHKFSPEERKLIYNLLSRQHDTAYGGQSGTANLPTALCNINGYSEIMLVWFYPPQPKRAPLIKVSPNQEKVTDMMMEAVKDQSYATMNKVRSVVKNLHMIYEKETRPRMTDETKYHYGDFKRFMVGFIDFIVEKYSPDIYPGHFRSGSTIFQQWIKVMKNKTNSSMETSDYLAECQNEL